MVQVASWTGLRAGKLAGLQVRDVNLRDPHGPTLTVARKVQVVGGVPGYGPPKTHSSRRTVPLRRVTADLLAGYLAEHPHADIQSAPLFPDLALIPPSRAGIAYGPLKLKRRNATREPWRQAARRQATALAELTVPEHAARLLLDWGNPLQHKRFYRGMFQPSALRAGLSPALKFHSLRHAYSSLAIAAGIKPQNLQRALGHQKLSTTLGVYTHLLPADDHADDMALLDALDTAQCTTAALASGQGSANVIRLRRR